MKAAILKRVLRGLCRLPAPVVRWLAGPPIIVDGRTLDPTVQMTLKLIAEPPGHVAPLQEMRAGFDALGDALTDPWRADVSLETHVIDGPAGPIPCEIHRPPGSKGAPAPGLLFYHGGGHAPGSLTSHRFVCNQLAH